MTKIFSVFSAVFLTLALSAVAAFAAINEKTLRVDGMTCGGCSSSVEQAIKKLDGVVEVEAKPDPKGTVRVKYDDQKVGLAKIKQVINDTGFKVVDK
ncbi:MAG: cation transporter [Acidobacteriales bacterium]|nr:cation transporter [Terriglobales bacterium]